ncbi:MAG TPA: diguanylate cyclase, partial [Thermoleophilia bacterium]
MSRPPRRRRNPALLRGRFRTLFFLLLGVSALLLGHRVTVAPCLVGVLLGAYSVSIARARGNDLGHTFAVADWLLLGCALALSGGADSWLLGFVPMLALGQLAGAPRREWPYLLAPTLLLLIVLAIADPSLGGSRAGGVTKLAVLVGGGWVAATRLRRAPPPRRRPARVDDTTGFYTGERLTELLMAGMESALAEHRPLSVVCLRLEHFGDCRDFLGSQGSELLVKGVARRIERHLDTDDRAFRVRADSFVLVLPGRSLAEAREIAAGASRDVSTSLIAGRRQTLAAGAASFPTVRRLEDLLAAARDEAAPAAPDRQVAQRPLPIAAAL